jgi:hypothetical protein
MDSSCGGARSDFVPTSTHSCDHALSHRYLNNTMNDGILSAFTALSVHPYRGDAPESVLDDYARLRAMMASHGVTDMPVLSGEWG